MKNNYVCDFGTRCDAPQCLYLYPIWKIASNVEKAAWFGIVQKREGRIGNNNTSESPSTRRWGNKKWGRAFVNRHSPKAILVRSEFWPGDAFFLPHVGVGRARVAQKTLRQFSWPNIAKTFFLARAFWQFVFCALRGIQSVQWEWCAASFAEPTSGIWGRAVKVCDWSSSISHRADGSFYLQAY